MYSKSFVSAVAALGLATGAAAVGCSDPTATVESSADATALASCTTIKGSVVISPNAGNEIDMSGSLSQIGGDLTVENNGALVSFSSTSLRSIGGAFKMTNVTLLQTLKFTSLTSVGSINWASLTNLPQLTFGTTGITSAKTVVIADTLLNTLLGINVQSVESLNINNNKKLTQFTTSLVNLTDVLNINANGLNLSVEMPNLQWAANMTISNVTSFSAPSLAAINGSIRFDSNYMESFSAPNLTEVQTGDLSFVSNSKVTNISFPVLETVGGGFTIANNSALEDVSSFPKLKMVGGAVLLRGEFKNLDTPALNDVRGAFRAASTEDIQSSCDNYQKLKDGGEIAGDYDCSSKDTTASNSTSADGSGNSDDNSSFAVSVRGGSMSWIISLVSIAGFVTAFL